jgi:hypothetical protein
LLNDGHIVSAFQVEMGVDRNGEPFPPKCDGGKIGSKIILCF